MVQNKYEVDASLQSGQRANAMLEERVGDSEASERLKRPLNELVGRAIGYGFNISCGVIDEMNGEMDSLSMWGVPAINGMLAYVDFFSTSKRVSKEALTEKVIARNVEVCGYVKTLKMSGAKWVFAKNQAKGSGAYLLGRAIGKLLYT